MSEYYGQRGDSFEGEIVGILIGVAVTIENPLSTEQVEFEKIFANRYVRELLQVNEFEGVLWFNRERWLRLVEFWRDDVVAEADKSKRTELTTIAKRRSEQLVELAEQCQYQVEALVKAYRRKFPADANQPPYAG